MNNTTQLQEIVTMMESQWTAFKCYARNDDDPYNTFLFGYPQEKDDHHSFANCTMVVNPPSTSIGNIQIDREVVKYNTTFTLQIYKDIPSSTFGKNNSSIYPSHWDEIETCFYVWLQNVLNGLGTKVQMGSGSITITRRNQSSNDQQFQIECKFNLDYFFTCIQID